eukprot:6328343-Heterocapsa_arctica.AAC.1
MDLSATEARTHPRVARIKGGLKVRIPSPDSTGRRDPQGLGCASPPTEVDDEGGDSDDDNPDDNDEDDGDGVARRVLDP